MTTAGGAYTAAELQQIYLDLVVDTFEETGTTPTAADQEILTLWQSVLDRMRADLFSVASDVEWVGKYQLIKRQKERAGLEWNDPRLAAIDLQWADLRPSHGLVYRLAAAGMVTRLVSDEEVERAADVAPTNTRAHVRGWAVASRPDLVKASWSSLVFDPGEGDLIRFPIADARDTSTR